MAKKKETSAGPQVMESVQQERVAPAVKEVPVVKAQVVKATPTGYEFRTRNYYLLPPNGNVKWYRIQDSDKKGRRLTYFDKEFGTTRPLRYASNMETPFIDEQEKRGGTLIREDVVFEHGILNTSEREVNLQKFLDKHPRNQKNGGSLFYEQDLASEAEDELDVIEQEHKAISSAMDLDVDIQEAIMRPILDQRVYTISQKELKREVLRYAKSDPANFLKDVNSDLLFNLSMAYKAVDLNILALTDGNRVLRWAKTGDVVLEIGYGKEQFPTIAEWFFTDEGQLVLDTISKKV